MTPQRVLITTQPKVLNPLWIISLFLTLSELAVVAAAMQTRGWLQDLLIIYSVIFPTGVATMFFAILIKKPFVLYAPKDYSSNPTVNDFVSALNTSRSRGIENMEASIRLTIEEAIPKILDGKLGDLDHERIVTEAVRAARADFLQRTLRISFSALDITLPDLLLPVSDDTRVQEVLDEVWSAAQNVVPAFSYGREWILLDPATRHRFGDIGSAWAQRTNGEHYDRRTLSQVGIRPGAQLTAARLD